MQAQIGAGASAAGRDPHALVVDERLRWQADNGTHVAQTADQLRNLSRTGLGDPYQFAVREIIGPDGSTRLVPDPGGRVPLDAVRYWEDTIAAAGPVVNGRAELRVDGDRLLLDIIPQRGERITVEVEGVPVISTGFPPEAIPGVHRELGLRGSFAGISKALAADPRPAAAAAKAEIDALNWTDAANARPALDVLARHGIATDPLPARAVSSLQRAGEWHQMRLDDPTRVVFGDEANLRSGVDPSAARDWVIAGTGGTGISAVENMLRLTEGAAEPHRFVMLGRGPTEGLAENTQWRQVRDAYDGGYNPARPAEASTPSPSGGWQGPPRPAADRVRPVHRPHRAGDPTRRLVPVPGRRRDRPGVRGGRRPHRLPRLPQRCAARREPPRGPGRQDGPHHHQIVPAVRQRRPVPRLPAHRRPAHHRRDRRGVAVLSDGRRAVLRPRRHGSADPPGLRQRRGRVAGPRHRPRDRLQRPGRAAGGRQLRRRVRRQRGAGHALRGRPARRRAPTGLLRRRDGAHGPAADGRLRGPPRGGTSGLRDLSALLGRVGDEAVLRQPGAPDATVAPGVRVVGAEPVPGTVSELAPLLRTDRLPAEVDVMVGHEMTAGVADRHKQLYPEATLVQVVDRPPTQPGQIEVLSRADVIVARDHDVAEAVRAQLDTLGGAHRPEVVEIPPAFEARPTPPPRGPREPFELLVHDGNPTSLTEAAQVARELSGRGLGEVRLTVTTSGDAATLARELRDVAGVEVRVQRPPRDAEELTDLLHGADLVLMPERAGHDGGFAALEHGVPVIADGRTGPGVLLRDGGRVPAHLAEGSVIGRDGGGGFDARAWADRAAEVWRHPDIERGRALVLREHLTGTRGPDVVARELHDVIARQRPDTPRVSGEAFARELNPREVVLRRAGAEPPAGDGMRVMTVCDEYISTRGGVATANRDMTEAFGNAGVTVHGRVGVVDPARPGVLRFAPGENITVSGVEPVWGVHRADGTPDNRALPLLLEGLPAHVDVIVGNSRFGGGAAKWLAEHVYPGAKYVHVLHTAPEVLDALRGKVGEGLEHAATERKLMAGADLVAGVGALLAHEAGRLSAEANPGNPPPVHTIISDMIRSPGEPHARPADRDVFELLFQGRANDDLKGVDFLIKVARELQAQGIPAHVTARGVPHDELAGVRERWADAADVLTVVEFVSDRGQLLRDLYDADLVLMPSIHEGFGLAASEAARAGVPVLVGEGTGAGMFFGDRAFVPGRLGEAAVVHDGVTVEALTRALDRAAGPDGELSAATARRVVEEVNQARLNDWVEATRRSIEGLTAERGRAVELRDYLNQRYSAGNAARELIARIEAIHEGRDVADVREAAAESRRSSIPDHFDAERPLEPASRREVAAEASHAAESRDPALPVPAAPAVEIPPPTMNHVLHGDVNAQGEFGGWHLHPGPDPAHYPPDRFIRGEIVVNADGSATVRGVVGHLDESWNPIAKDSIGHTFFPEGWTEHDIRLAGEYLFEHGTYRRGGTFVTGTYRGVALAGYLRDGVPETFFPRGG
ncbi:glycosyltransferase [Luedemannella flava]